MWFPFHRVSQDPFRALALLSLALLCAACATTSAPDPATGEELEAAGSVEELYDRANAAFDSGDYVAAFDLYQAVLEREPRHTGSLVNSGVCARRLGDLDGALAWYDRALAVEPDDTVALQNRVLAGVLLGRFQESLPFAVRLAERNPGDPAVWDQLGGIYMRLGRFAEAAQAFDRALRGDNRNAQYHYQLGLARAALDDYAQAGESFTRALALNPNLREAYAPLVHVLTLAERYDEAWSWIAEGQVRGARFDPELVLELQRESGQVGPE